MLIQRVYFFRTEKDKKEGTGEHGIIIDNDKLIIDANAKAVDAPVWDYRRLEHRLTIEVDLEK